MLANLWRRLAIWWITREPHLIAPGIKAEVTLVLGMEGQIAIYHSKLPPDENPTQVYGLLLTNWLNALSGQGVTLDYETPNHDFIPLVRPSKEALKRLEIEREMREKARR